MPLCPKGVLMSGAPLLEVHGLRRAFGERVIIHDISFTLHCGEIVFIRGASGVGKSLLLRALAHLDPIQVQARCKSSVVQNKAMKHADHVSRKSCSDACIPGTSFTASMMCLQVALGALLAA